MNLVGKIMIVLILVMSILFMGFALAVYSTHRNWRAEADALKTRQSQLRSEKDQLENQLKETNNKLEFERAARREALAIANTRASQLNQSLLTKAKQYDDLRADHAKAIETVATAESRMQTLVEEVGALRDGNRIARGERNRAFMAAKKLTDEINRGEGDLRRMKSRNGGLMQQLGRMSLVLDRNDLSEYSPVDNIAPIVEGKVTRVVDGLVEVSIGADEGLQEGHKLKIFRLNGTVGSFLGSIEIVDTNSDRAVGRIVPGTTSDRIRKGDRVATKIL